MPVSVCHSEYKVCVAVHVILFAVIIPNEITGGDGLLIVSLPPLWVTDCAHHLHRFPGFMLFMKNT